MIIIGIAGASGSGKSTVAKKILEYYGEENCLVISIDCYYKNLSNVPAEEREKTNFDHPDSIDFDLLIQQLADLKENKPIQVPSYDFVTHTRRGDSIKVNPKKIIVIEGILALHLKKLYELYDVKIYVDTELDLCIVRRLQRDMSERMRTSDQVFEKYESIIKPMYVKFILPTRQTADLIIKNSSRHFNGDMTPVLDSISKMTKIEPLHRQYPHIISPTFDASKTFNSKEPGTLFAISGPSGVGKTSLLKKFIESKHNINSERVVAYTTRPKRDYEQEGVDYHFVSNEQFKKMLHSKDFLEHVVVFSNHYGILLSDVEDKIKKGISVIIDVTPEALMQVRKIIPSAKAIFISPPSMSELAKRLISRGKNDNEEYFKRYQYSIKMLEKASYVGYNYFIVNLDIDIAISHLAAIIKESGLTLSLQLKENSSLLIHLNLHTILTTIKENVPQLKDLNIDECVLTPLSSLTNSSCLLNNNGLLYFLRVPRQGNDIYRIGPQQENANLACVAKLKLYHDIIYYNTETGVYVTQYSKNDSNFNDLSINIESPQMLNLFKLVISAIKKLHHSAKFENDYSPQDSAEKALVRLLSQGNIFPEDIEKISVVCHRVKELLDKSCKNKVPSNNDISPYNMLFTDGQVLITDWESSGNNDPYWDIAKLSVECHFNAKADKILLHEYHGEEPSEIQLARFNAYKLLIEFWLMVWAKWQIAIKNNSAKSEVFEKTFILRLDNCRRIIASYDFKENIDLIVKTTQTNFNLPNRFIWDSLNLPSRNLFEEQNNKITKIQAKNTASNMPLLISVKNVNFFQSIQANPSKNLELALVIVKPDVVSQNKVGAVMNYLEENKFHVIGSKFMQLSLDDASKLYQKAKELPIYIDVLDLMTSGPVFLIIVEAENAISRLSKLKGGTEPKEAKNNTLRNKFGTDKKWNGVHCSDSYEDAKREIGLFFSKSEIFGNLSQVDELFEQDMQNTNSSFALTKDD